MSVSYFSPWILESHTLTPKKAYTAHWIVTGLGIELAGARGLWGQELVSLRRSFQESVCWADPALPSLCQGTTVPGWWWWWRLVGGGGGGVCWGLFLPLGFWNKVAESQLACSCCPWHPTWAKQTSVIENCGYSPNFLLWKISEYSWESNKIGTSLSLLKFCHICWISLASSLDTHQWKESF